MGKRYAASTWSWKAGVPGGSTCGATTRPAPARVEPVAAREKTAIARRRRTFEKDTARLCVRMVSGLEIRGRLSVVLACRGHAAEFHDLAGHLVDRALADVLDAVAHPLEVVRRPQQPGRAVDGVRVVEHVGEELAIDLVVEPVDLVVLRRDRPCQELVLRDERVEARSKTLTDERRHARDVDERLEERPSLVHEDDLADADAVV